MNKTIYLGMSVLDYMNFGMITLNQSIKKKQNYATWILTALLFILKPKIFFEDIADDVEEWFDTSNCDKFRPLPIGKNKKLIGLFEDELCRKNLLGLEQKHMHT